MEIVIKGEAKEIADLVLVLQGQRNQTVDLTIGGGKIATVVLDGLG